MKPNPVRQRKAAHKQRLALGRALHSIRMHRDDVHDAGRKSGRRVQFTVSKGLRKHTKLLLRTLAVLGS